MDFMNLNQAAHGDREHGFIGARLRKPAQDHRRLLAGRQTCRHASGQLDEGRRRRRRLPQAMKVMRFGDNMRERRRHRGR